MEEFILKVKNYPCLWDTNSVFFRDSGRKTAAWETVAQECGIFSVPKAKALWKRLRDSHREAMRRRKISQVLAPWKYEEIMEFLLPQSTVEEPNDNDEASISEEDDKITIEHETHDSRNQPIYVRVRKREHSLDSSEEKRRIDNERRIDRQKVEDRNRNASEDALKDLFSGLCQKTILLPKHLQIRVQREVFEAVIRAEEEASSFEIGYSVGEAKKDSTIEEPAQKRTVRIKREREDDEADIIM